MKFYVEKNTSKQGKEYVVLKVDLGYRTAYVSFDKLLITDLTGVGYAELMSLKDGDKIDVK